MFNIGFISLFAFTSLINCVFSEYNLTIVHVTDFHSHWFEFNENEKKCSSEESKAGKCFGGFPRLVTLVNDIRSKDQNVIVLSAGEFFLGRSLNAVHGWKMANAFLPYLGLDAMSLANQDFSSGMFELSVFLYGMNFPVLCANMWARETSFMYSRVNKSDILTVGGEKIGIIGYLHPDTLQKSRNAVSVKFSPEIPALQKEAELLKSEGVNKIIALGHSGYSRDMEVAKRVKGVDIVIGGNSDIVLDDRIEASTVGNIHGNYPRVHHSENEIDTGEIVKNKTLILHIPQHGKYVGKIKVTFDDDGKVVEESGEAILLDSKIKQDEHLLKLLEDAILSLEAIAEHSHLPDDRETLGFATDNFEARGCRIQECSLGNLVTDAILHVYNKKNDGEEMEWKPVDAVIFNSGAIRYPLLAGPITIKDLLHSFFVGDFLPRVKLTGQTLKKLLEHSIKRYDIHGVDNPGCFLQISGLRVTYSMEKNPGNRVQSMLFQRNGSFYEVEPNRTYIVAMPDFLTGGGDGFPKLIKKNKEDGGKLDILYVVEYLKEVNKITPKLDGRITLLGKIPSKGTKAFNNVREINISQNIQENMIFKVKQIPANLMNQSSINNSASFSKTPEYRQPLQFIPEKEFEKDKVNDITTETSAHLKSTNKKLYNVTTYYANNDHENVDIQTEKLQRSTTEGLTTSRATKDTSINTAHSFDSEEKSERYKNLTSNELDWNYTKAPYQPTNTSLKSVTGTLNTTVQDLVQTILPTLNSSTLLDITENAESLREELKLDKSLEGKITVTSLSPSEVTTLASNISLRDKALGTIFSSLMKEHRNDTETSSKVAKLELSPQTILLTNKTDAYADNEDNNTSNSKVRTRKTLNDTVTFFESLGGLQDLVINSVISALIDTVQENDTKISGVHEQLETTSALTATEKRVDHNVTNASNNVVEASSLSPNSEQVTSVSSAPTDGNEKDLEKEA